MMSDALMIFKEGDYWVNYQDGVKTVFAEIGAIRQSPEPQPESREGYLGTEPDERFKPIHHNIFEEKENDNGRRY